jgi:hypothetical protein
LLLRRCLSGHRRIEQLVDRQVVRLLFNGAAGATVRTVQNVE